MAFNDGFWKTILNYSATTDQKHDFAFTNYSLHLQNNPANKSKPPKIIHMIYYPTAPLNHLFGTKRTVIWANYLCFGECVQTLSTAHLLTRNEGN